MTRTRTIATLWCTALAATLAAYGCGSSSTVDTGIGGKTGGGSTGGMTGAGGGIVIITGTGGTPGGGTGGMTGGGTGGMTGGGTGGMGPVDAGPPMCTQGAMCTAPFMCTGTCNAGGQGPGTRVCTCRNNGTLNCAACMPADAGPPPPPMDAGPPVDAGPMCPGNVRNNVVCTVGTSVSPCARMNNGMLQTCTCTPPPATDAGVATDAGPDAAPPPPPMMARYVCM